MTIGFLLTDIEELAFFKEVVSLHPSFDYAAYVDLEDDVQSALLWLEQKNATIVSSGDSGFVKSVSQSFIPLSMISEYLTSLAHHAEQGYKRDIYTTKTNKQQDQRIAEILGGIFIES